MCKLHKNQEGFGPVEAILVLVIIILIGVVGVMVYNNHYKNSSNTTTYLPAKPAQSPSTKSSSSNSQTTHTTTEATSFVQTTYANYLSAINNASTNNTQPLGLVGLAAVKDNLASDFYAQAVASNNGSAFSCASQFMPNKYVVGSASSTGTTATVPLTIWNSADGSTTTSGMTVSVDLASLKITSVSCPS